jgi:hypothetical protein
MFPEYITAKLSLEQWKKVYEGGHHAVYCNSKLHHTLVEDGSTYNNVCDCKEWKTFNELISTPRKELSDALRNVS